MPHFYIPLSDRVHHPTKWIKRLEDGRVAGYHKGQGPNESPYVIDLYAQANTIGHGEENPMELLPTWFHTLLLGPSGNFVHLHHEVEDLDDWGMAWEITCFYKLDQEATELALQVEVLYKELNVSHLDSTCHLTRKLSLRFRGSGLVAGVPPTSIIRGVSGCPF